MLFVVGGGCFGEYQNLKMLERELNDKIPAGLPQREIVYGATDIVSGDGFAEQLRTLAAQTTGST